MPEVRLHLADEPMRLWEMTERALGRSGLQPPFWAFAWAGGQALARYVLDHPEVVRGRRVIDVATGCGLVAIAAAMAGAAAVAATDVDPLAVAAAALNASANAVSPTVSCADVLDGAAEEPGDGGGAVGPGRGRAAARTADVVLTGDVFYDKEFAGRMVRFLEHARERGADVLVGDLGRRYLPRSRFAEVAGYDVRVLAVLEGTDVKRTAVWRPAW